MQIKNVESTGCWSFKVSILILGIYFLLVFPCAQIFFRTNPWLYRYTDILFITVVALFAFYKTGFTALGFSTKYITQHLNLGLLTGGILLANLPLLEFGLERAGLSNHELFTEKPQSDVSYNFSLLIEKITFVFFIPLIEQIFFTGIILQSLLKKTNPVIAVYSASVIYTLVGFKLTLGAFGLGVIASILFKLTGTLYAAILFHISCGLGGELLKNIYPNIKGILGFLF